jgi:hypothetical protein
MKLSILEYDSVTKLETKVANLSLRQSNSDVKIKRRALGDLLNTTKRQSNLKQSPFNEEDDKIQFKSLDNQIEEHEYDEIEHGPSIKYDSIDFNSSLTSLTLNTKSKFCLPDAKKIPIFKDKLHRKHIITDKKQRKTIRKESKHICIKVIQNIMKNRIRNVMSNYVNIYF